MKPLYLVEHEGLKANYFVETDRDDNSLNEIVRLIRKGDLKPRKILEVDEESGTVENITEEVMSIANHFQQAAE